MLTSDSDRKEQQAAAANSGLANNVATAPGDLPSAAVQARASKQREQFRHDNTITPLAPGPNEPVLVEATAGELMPLARATIFYTTDGSRPDETSASVPMEAAEVDWHFLGGFLTLWRGHLPPQPANTVVRYRIGGWRLEGAASAEADGAPDIWAQDGQGFGYRSPWEIGLTRFAYEAQPQSSLLPEWAAQAVIYQIFVDRFHPGNAEHKFPQTGFMKKHGGNLKGITQALPYLDDLGVTCVWLTPIGESPSYHRYDSTDFYKIDPEAGTDDDLRELVKEAHARDIKVVLDFVPSHASIKHRAFVAAQESKEADSFSWWTFYEWPTKFRTFLDLSRSMPSFNTEDPGAREYLINSAVYWMREFGVDGYRIDHAIGPGMDFWVALRTATEAVNHEGVLFGEATDTPDSLRRYRGRLHGVLDFPLAQAFRHTFALRDWDAARFASYLDSYEKFMQSGSGRLSFLDNHDMNRFLFLAGNDKNMLRLAALCQFTLSPTPIVYYGTEIGMTHAQAIETPGAGGDSQVREDMPWDPTQWDTDLLAFYTDLIHMRRQNPLLAHSKRRTAYIDREAGMLGYVHSTSEGTEYAPGDLLVLLNLSDSARSLELPLPAGLTAQLVFQTAQEGVDVKAESAQLAVTLPAETGVVLGLK